MKSPTPVETDGQRAASPETASESPQPERCPTCGRPVTPRDKRDTPVVVGGYL